MTSEGKKKVADSTVSYKIRKKKPKLPNSQQINKTDRIAGSMKNNGPYSSYHQDSVMEMNPIHLPDLEVS